MAHATERHTERLRARRVRAALPGSILVIVLVSLLAAVFPPIARDAQARSLYWQRYDTTIDLHRDGTFTVTEDQLITFEGGSFSEGYAIIPLGRVEDIDNLRVAENDRPYRQGYGQPGTYSASVVGGEVELLWWFEPAANESRQFTISYDVIGGLRVYDDREQLWWRAVDEEFAADIREATVTINLPQPVPQEQFSLAWHTRGEPDVTSSVLSPTSARVTATGLKQGNALEARFEFPRMTAATAPDWQAADDERREREERIAPYRAAANAIMAGVGLLLLVAGMIGIYILWFTRGRDAPVRLPIDLLRTPPDDLPAAAVGTLIDERAHDHDVIAGIVALGERGVIQIEEKEQPALLGLIGGGRDFIFRRVDRDTPLAKHERELLEALFGNDADGEVRLSQARERFSTRQERVKSAIYDELVERGYFPHSPQSVRRRYRGAAIGLLALSIFGAFFIYSLIGTFAPLVIVPFLAAIALAVALMVAGGAMPRKTQAGAEAAAKWLAFRRYLAEIERYDNVADAKAIFDRYLPYAVAFELERSWVSKFASVGAEAPQWYGPGGNWDTGGPRRVPRTQRRGGDVIVLPGGGGGGGDVDFPDMGDIQDASDRAGRSLQGSSDSLFDLFNEAAKAFTSYNSGGRGGRGGGFGGFSGGGGSFGGGGGGGGRGFR